MSRLLYFVGVTVGGWLGWYAAEAAGLGMMPAFALSTLGSGLSIYVVYRVLDRYGG